VITGTHHPWGWGGSRRSTGHLHHYLTDVIPISALQAICTRIIKRLLVYLSKSIGQAAGLDERATEAQRDHAHRLHAELQITPCSPRCPVWLLYGIQPQGARCSMTPGRCKGKAHQLQHLGIAGRRVLVSRKWSNKTLDVPLCSTSTRIAQRRDPQVSRRTAGTAVAGSVAGLAGCVASSGGRRSHRIPSSMLACFTHN
jgi:hypothetical protein